MPATRRPPANETTNSTTQDSSRLSSETAIGSWPLPWPSCTIQTANGSKPRMLDDGVLAEDQREREDRAGQQRGAQVRHDHPPRRDEPGGAEVAGRLDQRLDVDRAQAGVERPEHERQHQHDVDQRQDRAAATGSAGCASSWKIQVPGLSRPQPSTVLTPATSATGEMTSGTMQIVSTYGAGRGSRRWIASIVGIISAITITIVSSAIQSVIRRLAPKPGGAEHLPVRRERVGVQPRVVDR